MRLTGLLLLSASVSLPAVAVADIRPVSAADAAYQSRDYAKAAKLWGEACSAGNPTGCFELAIMYRDGEGVTVDTVRTRTLYEQACTGGDGRGCFNIAQSYSTSEGGSDDKTAATYFQRGCDAKYDKACANLGFAYQYGKGVPKDETRASKLFSDACQGGAARACFWLSSLYDIHDKGVVRDDPALANAALAKGCDQGDSDSCKNLGYHYRVGYGVAKNQVRVASLYLAACDNGLSMDCMMLGREWFIADVPRYAVSDVPENYRQTAGIYQAACDDRFAQGCLSLGLLIWRSGTNCTAQHDRILDLANRALALNPTYPLAVKFLGRLKNGDCPKTPL